MFFKHAFVLSFACIYGAAPKKQGICLPDGTLLHLDEAGSKKQVIFVGAEALFSIQMEPER